MEATAATCSLAETATTRSSAADGDDTVVGTRGDNTLYGGAGNDVISGGVDNNTMHGGDGDDVIQAIWGTNEIYGDAGNDWIDVAGSATITGGEGNDTFSLSSGGGNVLITDFQEGDRLLLTPGSKGGVGLSVSYQGENTVINYGATVITLEGAHLSLEDIQKMQK